VRRTRPLAGRLAATAVAMRDVAAQPPLRRAELAYGLACTSDTAFTVTLGVVAFRAGGAGAVGLVALLRMLPSAFGSTVLTAYADRLRRERVLEVASLVRAVAVAVTAVLVAAGASAVLVYVLAIVVTAAMTIFRPVHSALLPLLCRDTTELTSANVVRGVLEAVATLAGPILAGVLMAVASPAASFAAIAVVTLFAVVPLLGIRSDAPPPVHVGARAVAGEAAEGVRVVAARPDLRLVFGLGFAQTVVRGALNVIVVVVAFDLLGTDDSGVATLAAALGVGGLLGSFAASLLVGSRHLGAWLAVALALWGLPIAAMAGVSRQVLAFSLIAVIGIANALIDVPLFTLPVRLVDDAVLARAFGVFEAMISLGVGLGSVASPILIAIVGLRPTMIATGLLLPVLAVVRRRRLLALDARLGVRDEEIRVLRATALLGLLPVPTLEHLASRLRRRTVPAGVPVFVEGELGDRVDVVVRGRAEVTGGGRLLATLGPGDAFGEIAVLRDVPRTATVTAVTELEVFELARADFLAALGRHQASADAAYAAVARMLSTFSPAWPGA
jgi:MFS family permease